MNSVHFRNLDLNLLRVLLALLDQGSVSRAAQELSLTPSAVSHALRRLRLALGDPLFERRGGGLVPTAFALETGRRIRPPMERLRDAISRDVFDPATTEREFVVAAGSYVAAVFMPALVERLAVAAPNVRLRLRRIEDQSAEDVEHGRLDLLFGVQSSLAGRLEWEPFATEDMVWVARRGHPHIRAPLTMDMLAGARHIIIEKFNRVIMSGYPELRRFVDESRDLGDATQQAAGQGRRHGPGPGATLIVTDPIQAIAIAARTDQVTLTLRRMAQQFEPKLQLLEPPHPTPRIEMGLLYHPDRARDPAVRWLIGFVLTALGEENLPE
ncbi:MAG: LysR family transcriptional regulator [Hyphomonadaceae bacterium]